MKVELLKEVMLPNNGTKDKANEGEPQVGATGDVVDMADTHAKAYIKKGLAKESKEEVTRETKPATTAAETKPVTSASVAKPGPTETK